MKKLLTVIALGAVLGLGGVAGAKEKADKPLKGKITAINKDADNKSTDVVVTHGKTKEETTVVADDTATVTVDGNAAHLADLVVGETVTVTPATGKPVTIAAATAHKKKDATAAAPAAPAAPAAK